MIPDRLLRFGWLDVQSINASRLPVVAGLDDLVIARFVLDRVATIGVKLTRRILWL